jgi:hypothetical protein
MTVVTQETLSEKEISGGVVHDLPAFKKALIADAKALETWEDITPLARNEWICWIESAKQAETRTRRIEWGCSNLKCGGSQPKTDTLRIIGAAVGRQLWDTLANVE